MNPDLFDLAHPRPGRGPGADDPRMEIGPGGVPRARFALGGPVAEGEEYVQGFFGVTSAYL